MVKAALLISLTLVFVESLTRTNALLLAVLGIVQLKLPTDALVPAVTTVQLVPLFVLYSILTLLILTLLQVILWILPIFHTSPPFGELTVTPGATRMVKTALLESLTVLSVTSLTFTSAVVLAVLGTVQLNGVLEADTLGVITVQLVPLFVLYSSFTLLTFALLQLIF